MKNIVTLESRALKELKQISEMQPINLNDSDFEK
jgi:hypothetical protein